MKVFFAVTGKKEPVYLINNGFMNVLGSYHYYKKDKASISYITGNGGRLFVDSGAFSAHNAGAAVNIDEYSEYLCEVKPALCVSLDVIGDAEATLKNWEYQRDKYSLGVMPTFHMNEPLNYLDHYIKQCDYIALGGMVGSQNIEPWLDAVWRRILMLKPDLKVHGFGMTTADFIYKYPWESFDSSSFKSGKRFGRIPQFNGKHLYNVSMKSFAKRLGISLEEGQALQELSDLEGCKAYTEMTEYLNSFNRTFEFKNQQTLF